MQITIKWRVWSTGSVPPSWTKVYIRKMDSAHGLTVQTSMGSYTAHDTISYGYTHWALPEDIQETS